MTDSEYKRLVRSLELDAHADPRGFRFKVVLISLAAYLALGLLFLMLGGVLWLGFVFSREVHSTWLLFKLGLVGFAVLALIFVVLRAFLRRLEAPSGREINAAEAPQLFAALNKIREKLQGPPIHHVLIDGQFNAAIAQIPRFGLFGGHRNYLVVGLPYLYASSVAEMLATLAHEYGHLAGEHGKLGAWIYRQRRTFAALFDKIRADAENNKLQMIVFAPLAFLFPYYNAYTFVHSRQQEYEADATASRIVGPEANASGLVRGELLGRWLGEVFWPRLYAQAAEQPKPSFFPFTAMRAAFNAGYEEWAAQARLDEAARVNSELDDTHPCLRDRLRAIGVPLSLPKPVEINAADGLLGLLATQLAKETDQDWWREQQSWWSSYHLRRQQGRKRIAELSPRPLQSLNTNELWDLGYMLEEEGEADKARSVLEVLLGRSGGPFPKAERLYGLLLLSRDDTRGLEHLRQAAINDASLAEDCARRGYFHILQRQGEQAAEDWLETLPHPDEGGQRD